ncbi:hypothetical protein D9615_007885 [Tricholomella constricta]|uniref:Uncharacterized protein n=1 Tax=Tricholomella constricta TaxID=117010 RepID=A0A8H5M0W0_9AGAR|nr:hypothetical protein D9615_007885 [Tricholomella constricta]
MAANFTLIDDTDPSVHYGGLWHLAGSINEFQNSTHNTNEVGAQATITFTGGSFIEVYGTIGRGNDGSGDPSLAAITSYTLDGDPNTTTVFVGAIGSVILYKQLFYTSRRLAGNEQHTLVITYTTANKNLLRFDYARIWHDDVKPSPQLPPQLLPQLSTHPPQSSTQISSQPGHDPDTQSSSQLPPQLSPGLSTYSALQSSTQAIPQPTSQPNNTSQAPSPPNNTESPGLSNGVIAAIAVGSFVALLLVVMIVFLLRCLSRQSKRLKQTSSSSDFGTNLESKSRWPWNSRPSTLSRVSPFQGMPDSAPAPRLSSSASPFISQPFNSAFPPGYTTRGGTFADTKGLA